MIIWALTYEDEDITQVDSDRTFKSEDAMIAYLTKHRLYGVNVSPWKIAKMEVTEVCGRESADSYISMMIRDKKLEFAMSEEHTREQKDIANLIRIGNKAAGQASQWETVVEGFALAAFDPKRCKTIMGHNKYALFNMTKYLPDVETKREWLKAIKKLKNFSQFQMEIDKIIERYG